MEVLRFFGKVWVTFTAVIGSLFVIGVAFSILAAIVFFKHSSSELPATAPSQKVISQNGPDKIAVVNLSGQIMDSDAPSGLISQGGVISARRVIPLLDSIEKDSSVKAVVLRLNTPGGAVVASDEIYQRIKQLREKKPVVVNMADEAASGGYYISAGASKIVANSATITGSIGVIAELPKFAGLYDKLGIQMRTIKSGTFKDIGSPNRDLTPDEQAILQTMVNEAYDQFVHSIAVGRNMDETKVRQLADGRIYTGLQAQKNGLVDELGDFNRAIAVAENLAHTSNTTVVEYSDQSFFESLLQSKLSGISPLSSFQNIVPQEKFGLYYLLSM